MSDRFNYRRLWIPLLFITAMPSLLVCFFCYVITSIISTEGRGWEPPYLLAPWTAWAKWIAGPQLTVKPYHDE